MNAADVPALSTQQLLYLRAAARAATWTDAAAELGVTQSALSQGIAELERRLGLELFERRGRRRVLSPAGQEVLTMADGVLAQAADLGRVADQLRHGTRGTYRLGLIDSAAVATCRPALAAARELAGDSLHVIVDTSVPLTQAVQRGELDLAIVVGANAALRSGGSGRAAESSVTSTLIAEESLVVVTPGSVNPEVAADPGRWGPWVMPPEGSTTRILIDEALRTRGANPATTLESSNPTVLLSMVALGLGWAALPAHMKAEGGARPGRTGGVVIGHELVRRPLVAVARTGAPADPRTQAFLAAVDR
ncbi:MAG: LysR family transcriptional regulator [Microthrixaceae bacterium]